MADAGVTVAVAAPMTTDERSVLRSGRRLEYFTLSWSFLEGVVSVAAGVVAGSPSLVGFGVDSFVEASSGAVLLWRLQDHERHAQREALALRLVGVSLLLLAAYVAFEAGKALLLHEAPEASWVGVTMAALSVVVMPLLARRKRKVAARLDSRALKADSRQTELCAFLSAILLGGLLLNAVMGWWWADPVAGLAMAPIIAEEGAEALRGETCDGSCH